MQVSDLVQSKSEEGKLPANQAESVYKHLMAIPRRCLRCPQNKILGCFGTGICEAIKIMVARRKT